MWSRSVMVISAMRSRRRQLTPLGGHGSCRSGGAGEPRHRSRRTPRRVRPGPRASLARRPRRSRRRLRSRTLDRRATSQPRQQHSARPPGSGDRDPVHEAAVAYPCSGAPRDRGGWGAAGREADPFPLQGGASGSPGRRSSSACSRTGASDRLQSGERPTTHTFTRRCRQRYTAPLPDGRGRTGRRTLAAADQGDKSASMDQSHTGGVVSYGVAGEGGAA